VQEVSVSARRNESERARKEAILVQMKKQRLGSVMHTSKHSQKTFEYIPIIMHWRPNMMRCTALR